MATKQTGALQRLRRTTCSLCWLLAWAVVAPAYGQVEPAVNQPLFDGHELLELQIQGPLGALARDRSGSSEYHPAQLSYHDVDDVQRSLAIELHTRGKTRRRSDFCAFPPLRVRFDADSAAGTLFAGQHTLKLVTHCQDRDSYEQLVLQEYLAYRVYNLLTERSHRVRLARISYLDDDGARGATRYGIFLEHWRAVASRNGLTPLDADGGINIHRLSVPDANRVAVFQYLIGNQDWSMLWPAPDDECCHNTKPLLTDDRYVVPLPYDFDFSGIVNAPYAVPRPPAKNVRSRRYAGLCATQSRLDEALALFRDQRDAIYALYQQQAGVNERRLRSTLGYLDDFYEIIDDPERVARRMVGRCRED